MSNLFLYSVALFAVVIIVQPNCAVEPPIAKEVNTVREQLSGHEFDGRKILRGLGKDVFPEYEVILKDPKSEPIHVMRALGMIQQVNTDRSKFLPYALERLSDPLPQMRGTAARFVGAVGSEKDTPLLLVLLSDQEFTVAYAAATALTKLGGERDLMAMKLWLAVNDHKNFRAGRQAEHEVTLKNVAKFCDDLKARLEKEKSKK